MAQDKQPPPVVSLSPWKGLGTNQQVDPSYLTAADNIQFLYPGVAFVRLGLKPVTFSNQSTQVNSNIIGMTRYQSPLKDCVLFQLADGKLRLGTDPT